MSNPQLQEVADTVVSLARQQGHVVQRDVRTRLTAAGLAETLWQEVLVLAGTRLRKRGGRWYPTSGVSDRVRKEQDQQRQIQKAIRQLVRDHRAAERSVERREQQRVNFVVPVKVRTEDDREYTLLCRDISITGIRLLGTRRLLGQKVRVVIGSSDSLDAQALGSHWTFVVRVLWTCAVGDDLVENGGTFLEVIPPTPASS